MLYNCLYRSPSQSTDEMHTFLNGFEQICNSIALESPYCSFILGDLNAKNTNWWPGGTNNTCGIELYNLNTLNYLINVHLGISVHPGICYRN